MITLYVQSNLYFRDDTRKNHKFGLIYQAVGDTTQQDLFNRSEHSERMEAFITMLGTKVELAKHEGYFGGLHNFAKEIQQNGEQDKIKSGVHSLYTEHDNKGVMFHVSTLLPTRVDGADSQQIEVRVFIGLSYQIVLYIKI